MPKKSITVVKVGGAVLEEPSSLAEVLSAFSRIQGPKVLVHGGGRRATAVASQLGIENVMVQGRRVTPAPMLDVTVMVYAGLVSKQVVAKLNCLGVKSIGVCGADMACILSHKRPVVDVDYGFVGDVEKVDAESLRLLIDGGIVPVVGPITCDKDGQLLNTNADTIASSVACALAEHYDVSLVFCFEKPGVMADPDDESSVFPTVDREKFATLVESGVVNGGMVPKLTNAFAAIDAGVSKVIITKADCLGTNKGTVII